MTPEQALLILVEAAHQARLSYSDHQAVDAAKDTLVKELSLGGESPPQESE